MTTINTKAAQIVKDQAKLVAEPIIDAKIGPRIDPKPKAPVLIAERLFFKLLVCSREYYFSWCSRIWFRAGTQLLLISAPPMPPTRMPTQITLTLFGRNGTGPVSNIPKKKNTVPAATIF